MPNPNAHARPRPDTVAALGPYRRVELEAIASESSEAERRAEAAERELMDWKTAQFMESHLGEEYDALIISVQKFGFFVELTEIFVEGLVSIDRLEESTGQRCVYRERDHAIVTEPHRGTRGGSTRAEDFQARRSRASARRTDRSFPASRGIFADLRLHLIMNLFREAGMKPTVGLIGLGLMGKPMGRNLLKAGFPLVVWNRTKAKAEDLVREGAKLAADPRARGRAGGCADHDRQRSGRA